MEIRVMHLWVSGKRTICALANVRRRQLYVDNCSGKMETIKLKETTETSRRIFNIYHGMVPTLSNHVKVVTYKRSNRNELLTGRFTRWVLLRLRNGKTAAVSCTTPARNILKILRRGLLVKLICKDRCKLTSRIHLAYRRHLKMLSVSLTLENP